MSAAGEVGLYLSIIWGLLLFLMVVVKPTLAKWWFTIFALGSIGIMVLISVLR